MIILEFLVTAFLYYLGEKADKIHVTCSCPGTIKNV